MKKRLASLLLVILTCVMMHTAALATDPPDYLKPPISPYSIQINEAE